MKKFLFLMAALFCLTANAQRTNKPPKVKPGNGNTVAPAALSYPTPNIFTAGSAITALTPTVTGNVSTFAVSPALPAGLALNATTGTISGTPTAASASGIYTVTASNAAGSISFGVGITVNAPLSAPSALSYPTPNTFTVGTPIAMLSPTVSGTVTSYSVSPALPSGLSMSTSTGKITGTPTTATATATYTVTASNAAGSRTFGVVITVNAALAAPSALSYTSPNTFTAGTSIAALVPVVSGTVTSYSVSPSLPAGLSISNSTGIISGTPTVASPTATYTVTASNAAGSRTFGVVITVNAALAAPSSLSYTSPNTFVTGTSITALMPVVTGTVSSYSVSPSLPAGLSLSTSTGIIAGTPTAATPTATYTVTASNAAGSRTFGVVITVNAALTAPSALSYPSPNTFTAGTAIATLSPTVSGTVTAYSISPSLPAGLSMSTSTGKITGTPTTATTTATYTVTASNAAGSRTFGVVITVNAPVSSTPSASNVTYTASSTAIANPERGFYKHTETHSTGYYPLSQTTLTGYRTNSNITLILRVFYLENFINGPISSTYLQNMQTDFARIRAAGLKCIVRFAYADTDDTGVPHDATKTVILSHINQLTPILQANSDVIAVMQAGFIGSWGEWYYTDHFGKPPTAADYANRKNVVDAILAAVPNRFVQIRTPALKMNTYQSTTPLSLTQAYTGAALARLGHHNDCFLASSSDYGTYSNVATEYPYLEQETKFTPMGGETCAVNAPRSECSSAVTEMAKFHWSYMNLDYHETVISEFQTDGCFTEMQNRMGYRFELLSGSYPSSASLGSSIPVNMQIRNTGFATPYNPRVAYVVFRNTVTNVEYRVPLASNVRMWNPATVTAVTENIALPAEMVQGSYRLFLHLPDVDPALANRPEYAIRLANSNIWEATTGYNNLNHIITVSGSTTARVLDSQLVPETVSEARPLTMYPVPANGSLTVEMDSLEKNDILVYNTLGQRVSAPVTWESETKATLNTSQLATGIYIVSVGSGDKAESRRIIVSH